MRRLFMFGLCLFTAALLFAGGGGEEPLSQPVGVGEFEVTVIPGEEYRHAFPLFLFVKIKNPPQMALWAETTGGEFIDTLMVTEKAATQGWLKAPKERGTADEIRRPETLPVWAWKRGIVAPDGVPLPTKESPLPDAVSQATPKGDFILGATSLDGHNEFYLFFEVNHSTDFNQAYPAETEPKDDAYNGGQWGSGQPALVYRAYVNRLEPRKSDRIFTLVGHSSPSGGDGELYPDLSGIDSALDIIKEVTLRVGE